LYRAVQFKAVTMSQQQDDLFAIAHHMTGVYKKNSTFLEDAEYSRALDTFVKGCADVILRDATTKEILIMKRIVHPQPDWWFLGGRMRAGETPQQAAAKNVKRETGLTIDPSRFRGVCYASYLWQFRKQEPSGNGTADIAVVQTAEVSGEERAAITADPAEYSASEWVAPQVVAHGDTFHPALRRAVLHLMMRDVWDQLAAATAAGGSDAEVAALARRLAALQQEGLAMHKDAPYAMYSAPGWHACYSFFYHRDVIDVH